LVRIFIRSIDRTIIWHNTKGISKASWCWNRSLCYRWYKWWCR